MSVLRWERSQPHGAHLLDHFKKTKKQKKQQLLIRKKKRYFFFPPPFFVVFLFFFFFFFFCCFTAQMDQTKTAAFPKNNQTGLIMCKTRHLRLMTTDKRTYLPHVVTSLTSVRAEREASLKLTVWPSTLESILRLLTRSASFKRDIKDFKRDTHAAAKLGGQKKERKEVQRWGENELNESCSTGQRTTSVSTVIYAAPVQKWYLTAPHVTGKAKSREFIHICSKNTRACAACPRASCLSSPGVSRDLISTA